MNCIIAVSYTHLDVYKRQVEAGSAPYVPRLFHDVYTGVDIRQKKALPVTELHKLLYEDPKSERLDVYKRQPPGSANTQKRPAFCFSRMVCAISRAI